MLKKLEQLEAENVALKSNLQEKLGKIGESASTGSLSASACLDAIQRRPRTRVAAHVTPVPLYSVSLESELDSKQKKLGRGVSYKSQGSSRSPQPTDGSPQSPTASEHGSTAGGAGDDPTAARSPVSLGSAKSSARSLKSLMSQIRYGARAELAVYVGVVLVGCRRCRHSHLGQRGG